MSEKKVKVSQNNVDGFQLEWHGILLTMQMNAHHGFFGSMAEMEDDKVQLLEFHGWSPKQPFPISFHENAIDVDQMPETPERPVFRAYNAITEIRLSVPEKLSPEEDAQLTKLLDIQDELWQLLTPEEIKSLDGPKK